MREMFNLESYNLAEDVKSSVSELIDSGADVTVEALVAAGVQEDTAQTIYADYHSFLSGGADGADGTDGADTAEDTQQDADTEGDSDTDGTESADSEVAGGTEDTKDYRLLYENYKTLYEGLLLINMINDALQGVEFTSPFARDGIINEIKKRNLEIQDGKLVGVDDLIAELKIQHPAEFKSDSKKPKLTVHRDTTPDKDGSKVAEFLRARYKDNPWFKS